MLHPRKFPPCHRGCRKASRRESSREFRSSRYVTTQWPGCTPKLDTLPTHRSQSGKQNGLWMSTSIEGKVSRSARCPGQSQGVGLVVVELIESARDRVAIKTFDSAMPERTIYTLYALGSVVRQWLLEDIMSHSPADEYPTVTPQPQGSSNSRD